MIKRTKTMLRNLSKKFAHRMHHDMLSKMASTINAGGVVSGLVNVFLNLQIALTVLK